MSAMLFQLHISNLFISGGKIKHHFSQWRFLLHAFLPFYVNKYSTSCHYYMNTDVCLVMWPPLWLHALSEGCVLFILYPQQLTHRVSQLAWDSPSFYDCCFSLSRGQHLLSLSMSHCEQKKKLHCHAKQVIWPSSPLSTPFCWQTEVRKWFLMPGFREKQTQKI